MGYETCALARAMELPLFIETAEGVPRRVQQTIRRWCVEQPRAHIAVEPFWCNHYKRGTTGLVTTTGAGLMFPTPHTGSEYRRQRCRCEWTNFDPNDSVIRHQPLGRAPADRRTGKHRHKHRKGPNTTGADWYYR